MAFELHVTSSLLALVLGAIILSGGKGTRGHRAMGAAWIVMMAASAISSFWLGGGVLPVVAHFGPIHLLSIWIMVCLAVAVASVRRGRIRAHRGWMTGAYFGLVGAFIGTLAPGRWTAAVLGVW